MIFKLEEPNGAPLAGGPVKHLTAPGAVQYRGTMFLLSALIGDAAENQTATYRAVYPLDLGDRTFT